VDQRERRDKELIQEDSIQGDMQKVVSCGKQHEE